MKVLPITQTDKLKKELVTLNKLFSGDKIDIESFTGDHGFYNILGEKVSYYANKQISKKNFMLLEPIIYFEENGENVIIVLPGLVHDYASKGFLKHTGKFSSAAIVHDSLYGSHIVSKKEADKVFLNAMLSTGTSKFKAYTYYSAVAAVGIPAYNATPKEEQEHARKFVYRLTKEQFNILKELNWNNKNETLEVK